MSHSWSVNVSTNRGDAVPRAVHSLESAFDCARHMEKKWKKRGAYVTNISIYRVEQAPFHQTPQTPDMLHERHGTAVWQQVPNRDGGTPERWSEDTQGYWKDRLYSSDPSDYHEDWLRE